MNIQKKVITSATVLTLLIVATIVSEKLAISGKKIATGLFFPDFEPSSVTSVVIGDSANTIQLQLRDGNWYASIPGAEEEYYADQEKAVALIDKIDIMEKEQLVSENKANQSSLGVVKGKGISVTVNRRDKDPFTFYIGKKSANWRLSNVRLDGENKVFLVSGSIRFAFKTEMADWRNKNIFVHDQDSITKVQLSTGVTITKDVSYGDVTWIVSTPVDTSKGYGPTVKNYIRSLSGYTAIDWAERDVAPGVWQGENPKKFQITLRNGDVAEITVGVQDTSGRGRFYAKSSQFDELFFVVPTVAQMPFPTYEYLTTDPRELVPEGTEGQK